VTDVLMERYWPAALTDSDVRRLMEMTEGCRRVHRVAWLGSWLSADGHDLLCHFRGPDAESMRIAAHESGTPGGVVWASTVFHSPGVLDEELDGANVAVAHHFAEALPPAAPLTDDGEAARLSQHHVRLLRRHRSLDGRRMVSVLRAPDEASAQRAMQDVGLPVERLWPVRRIRP
jgi:hypothetical protein